MVHEVDSPFSMDQFRTSIMDEDSEPARELANLVRVRMEPDTQATHPGLTKSDPIMIEPDIKASCAVAEPKTWGIDARETKKRTDCAIEIMSTKDYRMARFGRIPGNSPRLLWREDGSMYTQKGIQYSPAKDECELPLDVQMPEVCRNDIVPEHRRWQRGCRPETIHEDSKIIQTWTELYWRCGDQWIPSHASYY